MASIIDTVDVSAKELIPEGSGVLIAVSGGVDSMVLMYVLHQLAAKYRWRLVAAHFNHHLRGRSSMADERLVEKTAGRLGLKIGIGDWKKIKGAIQENGLEMAAREARLGYLSRAARRHRCRYVVTGHHADDQVETFFWRLLRGSGGLGLGGMKPVSSFPGQPGLMMVRPLLAFTKTEIREHARRAGISFREDETNRDTGPVRNRIRQNLLPLLRSQFMSGTDDMVRRSMELLKSDADCVKEFAAAWLEGGKGGFSELHLAMQRWVIWLQLVEQGIEPEHRRIEDLRLHKGKPLALDPMRTIQRDECGRVHVRDAARIEYDPEETNLKLGDRWRKREFGGITLKCRVGSGKLKKELAGSEMFDAEAVGACAVLRHWQPGDRFQPIGLRSSAKLQDLFTNAKVPAAEKRRRVLACTAEGEIFWVEGLRIGEVARIRPETRRILRWKWWRL